MIYHACSVVRACKRALMMGIYLWDLIKEIPKKPLAIRIMKETGHIP
ncbi:hypothetical protein JBKA6_0341 [Ichthyobacterium seriolicida]|uniref:Uncharacterized protein n=1 Tax=Ichthyobacterium seriolicida TaxID=242600 RepID=A0A1J1DWW5_9FLAO|nr:hypothetical protein JBKA6_0341 [Ichthyobacterium seriolicida]